MLGYLSKILLTQEIRSKKKLVSAVKTRSSENSRPLKQWVKVFASWQERVRRRST